MKIVALDCPKCGANLQISERVEQVACAHCGSRLHVDRTGGTISLQLAEAVTAIRTGTVQTAAELALVRLSGERSEAMSLAASLEGQIRLLEGRVQAGQLLSASEVSVSARTVEQLVKSIPGRRPLGGLAGAGGVVAALLILWQVWLATSGWTAFLAIVLGWIPAFFLLIFGYFVPYQLVVGSDEDKLKSLQDKLSLHEMTSKAATELNEKVSGLEKARRSINQTDSEISRNRQIVRGREQSDL